MMNVNVIRIDIFGSHSSRRAHAFVLGLPAALVMFFSASLCLAQSNVARFIPPNVPVIAGMHRTPNEQARDAMWLATPNNGDDLRNLVALTDHDPDRLIEQVIAADWQLNGNRLGNHLLIAQGRFNPGRVFPAEADRVVEKLQYDGMAVVAIDATGGSKPGARWLAMPQRDIALFGNPSAVQVALDRFRSGRAADPGLLERMKTAQHHEAAWSSVLLDSRPLQKLANLQTGDAFSACIARMREVSLGIQLAKTVTIDLRMEARDDLTGAVSGGSIQCVSDALFGSRTPEMRVAFDGGPQPHVRVTMARADYDAWLDLFRKSRTNAVLEAMISGTDPVAESPAENVQSIR